jgi:lysine-N-methylase
MPAPRLQLPTIQNWSCHSCAGCCRQHLIEITDEERHRIEGQSWTAADGIPPDGAVVEWHAGPPWKKRYRLAHQSDGACVFLDERGLCRIHAKFGEDAKPLACRIYPYAFHPAGKEVTISLRFSCPSVVANRGPSLAENRSEIKRLADAVVPEGATRTAPPAVSARERLEWPDVLRIMRALEATLAESDVPVAIKLLRALFWIDLVGQARFDTVRGDRLADFLGLITQAAAAEVPGELTDPAQPTRVGRMYFRMQVAQYARKDTAADLEGGWRNRARLLKAALAFSRGRGNVPPLQTGFQPVPFATLEAPFGGIPAEAEELLTRYFRVKIAGLHFCGAAYYGVPLVEGFHSLALMLPAVLWLARWRAAGEQRSRLMADDIAQAISVADHHHGYSPALGLWPARRRVRTLARHGDIARLIGWYSQ